MSDITVKRNIFTTRDLVMTAFMSVIIAVCSWISIPIGTVPFTLQTFAVFLSMLVLGGKKGTFAVLVYIMLGAVGIPVFAEFTNGIGVILGTTGGYILGFIIIGLIYMLAEKLSDGNLIICIFSLVIGLLLCYAFGTAWFIKVYSKTEEIDIVTALKWCVIPFIIPDIAKLGFAVLISGRIKKYADI